jgi:dTDP-glucose pyrophosphorylase
MKNISQYLVKAAESLSGIVAKIDLNGHGFVIVIDSNTNNVVGIITDADIRHHMINGAPLNSVASSLMNTKFIYVQKVDLTDKLVLDLLTTKRLRMLPVLDGNKIDDIIIREKYLSGEQTLECYPEIPIPLVVMAGGKGTRLAPFTHVLPKPLIPINGKPIIQHILDEFAKYSISKFYVSVNDKAEMIKAYFNTSGENRLINYIEENKPLGTAGSVKLIEGDIEGSFFLVNCDIIIKHNYHKIYDFHKKSKNDLTIIGAKKDYSVPYGVCFINSDNQLTDFKEKPSQTFIVNTGMYVLESHLLKLIPKDEFYHITSLAIDAKEKGFRVGVYVVDEDEYLDIGQWKEYRETLKVFGDSSHE